MSDIVERLLEPDRHDPECPFKNHCYCDGAPHDTVSHPLAAEAAETILSLRKEVEGLRGHVSEQVTHVETRIQDGIELGATVWRIALEDVARENRAALSDPIK